MAKRKRLSPAVLTSDVPLETKSAFGTSALQPPSRAPIADVARDASAQAALEELSDTIIRARAEGRMVLSVPLEAIVLDHLVRDRVALDGDEMVALKASLRTRGQQTPIEVMALDDGRYGLISGWRRCKALAALYAETGENRFTEVLALQREPDDAADAYLAMVEENEIRAGLSYFERARIAAKSVEQGVFDTEQAALRTLYQAASRSKRSKIGSFIRIVNALDGHLRFPEAIGERFGLSLSKSLEVNPALAASLIRVLAKNAPVSAEAEQVILAQKAALSGPKSKESDKGLKLDNIQKKQTLKSTIETKPIKLAPAVYLVTNTDGQFALSGAGVTADLRAALVEWVRNYG